MTIPPDGVSHAVFDAAWIAYSTASGSFGQRFRAALAGAAPMIAAAERDRIREILAQLPEPLGSKSFEDGWQAALANVNGLLGDQP